MAFIYGKNPIFEALRAHKPIHKIYVQRDIKDKKIVDLAREKGIRVEYKEKTYLDKITGATHQGYVCEIDDFEYVEVEELLQNPKPFVVILDGIEDPHNLGAILRVCDCCGVDGVIIAKNRSAKVNSTVFKTSAGAAEHVKVAMVTNINQTISELKDKGLWIVGTDLDTETEFTKSDLNIPLALVIGSEGFGLRKQVRKSCDFLVKIPMFGEVNSLNASVACGVVAYEVVRQRNL